MLTPMWGFVCLLLRRHVKSLHNFIFTLATISSVTFYSKDDGVYLVYTPFHEKSDNAGTIAWQAFANAGILLGVIAVMTVLLILAYKFRCYWLIHGWLFVSSLMLLFLFR